MVILVGAISLKKYTKTWNPYPMILKKLKAVNFFDVYGFGKEV